MTHPDPLRRFGRVLSYPVVMAGALAAWAALASLGVPAAGAGYAAAAAGAGAVVLLERWIPHRRSWRPTRRDLATDLVYFAAVQTALPVALGLLLAGAAAGAFGAAGAGATWPWPHGWPLAAQAGLLLLVDDLLRYGLHVAAHRVEPFWRLHAVHHATRKLYALSVGRFHPLERTFLYVLATLPFVGMGVGPEVLAPYFVFYAVNGFFQHANADVRLGPLNYLVSGPELHRWHHSRRDGESNRNYGVNLIVWDLAFGTYLLPRDRRPAGLGLTNPSYPRGFLGQLAAPFFRSPHRRAA
jgi:sterol desaturase/sphingolipid hydroxylase (fatty acid hydroxylase superfamily)